MSEPNTQDTRKAMLNKILTPREKQVITLRFGFGTNDPLTLAEVGDYMVLTRERIRQIEAKALKKLRHNPRLRHLKDYLD